MASIPSSLQLLVGNSLLSSAQAQSLSNATPSQLNQIVAGNSALLQEQVLFAAPTTAPTTTSGTSYPPDVVSLSNALLATLTPGSTGTPTSPPPPPANPAPTSPGINVVL